MEIYKKTNGTVSGIPVISRLDNPQSYNQKTFFFFFLFFFPGRK